MAPSFTESNGKDTAEFDEEGSVSGEYASSIFSSNTKVASSRGGDDDTQSFRIAEKESRQVFWQRLFVTVMLISATVAVSLAVYFVTSNAEEQEFEAHFQGGAYKIASSFEAIMIEKMGAVGSLCLALTASGKKTSHDPSTNTNDPNKKKHTWPFVTMDSFHERAASARILSNVLHMSVLPLVTEDNRVPWEDYSVKNGEWYAEGFAYQQAIIENGFSLQGAVTHNSGDGADGRALQESNGTETTTTANATAEEEEEEFNLFIPFIYEFTEYWDIAPPSNESAPFAPVWQSAPTTVRDGINLNVRSFTEGKIGVDTAHSTGELALRGFMTSEPGNSTSEDGLTAWYAELLSTHAGKPVYYNGDPLSEAAYPIFADFDDENDNGEREVVAVMNAQFSWQTYFEGLLPDTNRGFLVVLTNECDGSFTYVINGAEVDKLGFGDLHDPKFDHMNVSTYLQDGLTIHDGSATGVKLNQRGCPYSLHVYPSQEIMNEYITSMPIIITVCIVFIFLLTATSFVVYDRLVEKRQKVVVTTAKQSTDIIGSLFPENVRDRLLQDPNRGDLLSPNQRVKSYLNSSGGGGGDSFFNDSMKPIADLFPNTTVMFADISGFTAWSSTRDPSQVFMLLQRIYGEFDEVARRRNVFKVETIGDCYVACAGLPNKQPNHAAIMSRFAWECKSKLAVILKHLEVSLGPDTGDLSMRFGLHSGAVTAGVLRGDKARFQLFGDTVNTAARMEQTGVPEKIQVSHATANLLTAAGKGHWLESRDDSIVAKGKGVLNTFFVDPTRQEDGTTSAKVSSRVAKSASEMKAKKQKRLVQWMTEVLLERLRQIVARRDKVQGGSFKEEAQANKSAPTTAAASVGSGIPMDEVVEAIKLPDFDDNAVTEEDLSFVHIPEVVVDQLRAHVTAIAESYQDNPFHNFEHACHVTMSTTKFLGRIASMEIDLPTLQGKDARAAVASHIHDYTHGILSDPLTLFGIVYSSLIHDCDHAGVGNAQTIKENPKMGEKYQGKSVAEQNSLDIAWNLLMSERFAELRALLFANDKAEMARFRQVVVNIVLATDIFDKELNGLRKGRWNKAFEESAEGSNSHLRATIVLEHIIQASDVSHTMQHWHIYRKWNRRLFLEMYSAYKQGRMGADPSSFWYKGELGFFDNYIIPLAKKLETCGIFGVSSDECLTYAQQNRQEWEARGEEIVQELVEEAQGGHVDVVDETNPKSVDV
ncbi:Receptor-type guanylate cyclase gcy [Seminavis robusta]|uniref:Receptor-type guanylate cyclase gcy n=1 Tax=Seminavis robusta TaxID=568900 RepID=A0A9N8EH91_9STRA|nr:Receptor-type guanylate cyclase gcy [Seminavis robusta]|eukprot:Sro991_g228730.1 Receptor-type guanylate cyclase gcy (1216) ;mRNA; r:29066-34256